MGAKASRVGGCLAASATWIFPWRGTLLEGNPPWITCEIQSVRAMTVAPVDIRARQRVAELYQSLGHAVLRRARRILGSEAEAEDVLHDLFLRMAERPEELLRAREPAAFLYGAAAHACLNRIRDAKNRTRLLADRTTFREQHVTAEGESQVILRQVLATMPPELAEVTVYYHMDEMTHAEIAEVLQCSRRHVGDLLERARRYFPREQPGEATP